MDTIKNYAAPAGRLLLGGFWIYFGYSKIGAAGGVQQYMEAFGIPGFLVWGVIALELVAGAMILSGFYARFAAFALAGFSVMAALIFHNNLGDQTQFILFAKNIALAGGLLMIVSQGPGRLAVNQS